MRGADKQEISVTSDYSWSWAWGSSVSDSEIGKNIITVAATADGASTSTATAAGNDGRETAIATANISDGTSGSTVSKSVAGEKNFSAMLCKNPWPALSYFPFADTEDSSASEYYSLNSPFTNLSFYYCRDQGEEDKTDDDLPGLTVEEVSISPRDDIMKDILFLIDDTSDAIGVRVLTNEEYLSPLAWYEEQGFSGSPSETTLDGYQAVLDGNTYYVSAANLSGSTVYPNIYVISLNDGAAEDSVSIFEQIIGNWHFNANDDKITDINTCLKSDGSYGQVDGAFVSCTSDQDCMDADLGTGATCDAEKFK